MHIVIIFHNIGGYHAARLRAAHTVCIEQGWQLTAVQETDSAQEHPWGDLAQEIDFPLETLLPEKNTTSLVDRNPYSSVAASYLPACLSRLKPDVLLIPGWGYPISRAALKWARSFGVPTVLMSESKRNDEPRTWWKERIKSLLYVRKFQAAIVGGKLHEEYLIELGFSKESIFRGYDVVDNGYFFERSMAAKSDSKYIYQEHPDIPSRPYFLSVTRFIPRKNVLRLIEAFSRYRKLVKCSEAWDLVICGSGQEESAIRDKIRSCQLEKSIYLPGFQTYQTVPYWFGLANGFIHPALSEQWGLVVNEALATGLPSLVSDRCGCYPELIVEKVTGFGFDPYDVDKLASLMKEMSTGKIDLVKMRKDALAHIQKFSPDAFGEGFKRSVKLSVSDIMF